MVRRWLVPVLGLGGIVLLCIALLDCVRRQTGPAIEVSESDIEVSTAPAGVEIPVSFRLKNRTGRIVEVGGLWQC
jgi:hypothetical protein